VADVQQSFSTSIEAPVALCYAAIADFESYPSWSGPVSKAVILERYPDQSPRRVEFELDMKLKVIRYVLEYTWEPPGRLTWKMVEGDVSDIEGSYVFEPEGADRTQATCSQAVSLGFWVPGVIRRPLEQNAVRQSVLEFKDEAERRARASR
jgi:hypothetical protein